ncbi:MAG: response regulator [Verrucomicrobia bacterium]|nr:response regulator [Deltaproteobacteria bacterium]
MVTEQSHTSFSLLFVEDDKTICKVIGRMIARHFPDATVYTAENGLIGLELFKEHTPEIVIADINMPEMDGIEMSTKIKSIKTDTKIIVLTGYSDKNYLDKFSEIGFDDYIVKPVDFWKLFAAIEKCRAETTR